MSTISKADITTLFTDLVNATKNPDKDAGKQKFITIVTENKDKFNQPMNVPFANGNTINHSIARAVETKCERDGCDLCISKDASSFGTKYGESPYIVFNYIDDNDDVKSAYKKLFSKSYTIIENNHAKKYTPLDFAKTCNPQFAEYMEQSKQKSVSNSIARSMESVKKSIAKSAESVRKSMKSFKNASKKTTSVKDEDLTTDQLEAKIAELESTRKIRNYVFENSLDEKDYKHSEEYKHDKKEDDELDSEINRLKKLLDKKTQKSFLTRVTRRVFRKGGNPRKQKKSIKRRTYRRK